MDRNPSSTDTLFLPQLFTGQDPDASPAILLEIALEFELHELARCGYYLIPRRLEYVPASMARRRRDTKHKLADGAMFALYRVRFTLPLFFCSQRPLTLFVRKSAPRRITCVIENYRVIFSRRRPKSSAGHLQIEADRLRWTKHDYALDGGQIKPLDDDATVCNYLNPASFKRCHDPPALGVVGVAGQYRRCYPGSVECLGDIPRVFHRNAVGYGAPSWAQFLIVLDGVAC